MAIWGKFTFGYKAWYELTPERIKLSGNGKWRSAPEVLIDGTLFGSTNAPDLLSGDRWSKCWMIRRQTAFQNVFAPPEYRQGIPLPRIPILRSSSFGQSRGGQGLAA